MSAPCESAASPSPCACTNITLIQLFHELKQKFPAVPDHVVSNTIELYCHDKTACETHLHSEAKASLTHAYHASSSAAARLSEQRPPAPLKCPNQPIVKHRVPNATAVNAVACQEPQTATLSSAVTSEVQEVTPQITDANQNVVDTKNHDKNLENNNIPSPVTINIDKCIAKYHYTADSPSDLELTNDGPELKEESNLPHSNKITEDPEKNYKILKSNKIKCNLHEKLEKSKEKKTIKKEEQEKGTQESETVLKEETTKTPEPIPKIETTHKEEALKTESPQKESSPQPPPSPQNLEKPKRPNTLEFIKANPDNAFKPSLNKPEVDTQKSISPVPPKPETTPGGSYWPERGYPLNLSVNVNCHMDYGRGYDPWLENYDSPRAITSVNLTVCTPTSNMASPIRDEEGGFEGHVTVTVSPTSRAPRRRAPAPPPPLHTPTHLVDSPRNARGLADTTLERSLIERQKERLGRLAAAIAQERGRLAQLTRETQILAAPAPSPAAARKLKDYVHHLRDQCDTLAKRLEMGGNEPDTADFYSNIYTGQRPPGPSGPFGSPGPRPARPAPPPPAGDPPSWQCHVCTFRNHPLLDKCEECEMPRILVVRAHDGITVRLMPGRRKFVRSWVL